MACEAVRAAGRVLAEGMEGSHQVTLKDARTKLVSAVDLRSQATIQEVIRGWYPQDAVVGEEGTLGDPAAERVWFVDPLDGTTNYLHGLPWFGVSVALRSATDGVVCGAVYDPYHDQLFAAARGEGSTCNGSRLRVSDIDRLDQALVVTQVQSDQAAEIHAYAELAELLMNAARGVRSLGAPALLLCLIAAGRLEAYCERSMDHWDLSAGQLILEEAGGRITHFDGHPYRTVEVADVVASNGLIHDQLLEVIARGPSALP